MVRGYPCVTETLRVYLRYPTCRLSLTLSAADARSSLSHRPQHSALVYGVYALATARRPLRRRDVHVRLTERANATELSTFS